MANRDRRSDEGGSTEEMKGRVPSSDEEPVGAEGVHGDTDLDRDLEELERAGLAAGGRHDTERALRSGQAGRREAIANNPDNEEPLAEEALRETEDTEDTEEEAGHRGGRRG